MAAAAELLAEAGFARLTMEQVAARAEVSKASVYLRWPNKTALVADAIGFRADVVVCQGSSGTAPAVLRVDAEQGQDHLVHNPHQEVIVDRSRTEDKPLPQ